jgi:transcriptional repressor NrdR
MLCPFCDHPHHRVLESRVSDAKDAIRRRRECRECGERFTTYERVEETPLTVIKSSGEREPFDREKLFSGLQRACHKRLVTAAELEEAVRDIETELRNRLAREVPAAFIGDLALRRLKALDPVAYVRFASVYRNFGDVREFAEELERLDGEPPLTPEQVMLDEHIFDRLTGSGARRAERVRPLAATTAGSGTKTTIDQQEAPDVD